MSRGMSKIEPESMAYLVKDWLLVFKLERTIEIFLLEWKQLGYQLPTVKDWNFVGDQTASSSMHCDSTGAISVLEKLILERIKCTDGLRTKPRLALTYKSPSQAATIVVSKRPPSHFAVKRSLPLSSEMQEKQNSPSELSNGNFRPKTATVCKSTSDLIANTMTKCLLTNVTDEDLNKATSVELHTSQSASGFISRPATAISKPNRKHSNMNESAHKIVAKEDTKAGMQSFAPKGTSTKEKYDRSHLDDGKVKKGGDKAGNHRQNQIPSIDLDQMSEDKLMSEYPSLAKVAVKRLRRVLAKSSACSQELDRNQLTIGSIRRRAQRREVRCPSTSEQSVILSDVIGYLSRDTCSLCEYIYPKETLSVKVSYKSILDLRASWAAKSNVGSLSSGSNTSTAVRNGVEISKAQASTAVGTVAGVGMKNDANTPVAHLYDEVPVCAFCAQLVLDIGSYRNDASKKQLEVVPDLPLDVPSATNSTSDLLHPDMSTIFTDDNDDSDTEEFIVCDAAGRMRVINKKKKKARQLMTSVGIVSRRVY